MFGVVEAAREGHAILNLGRGIKDFYLPGVDYKMKYFADTDPDPFPYEDIFECVL